MYKKKHDWIYLFYKVWAILNDLGFFLMIYFQYSFFIFNHILSSIIFLDLYEKLNEWIYFINIEFDCLNLVIVMIFYKLFDSLNFIWNRSTSMFVKLAAVSFWKKQQQHWNMFTVNLQTFSYGCKSKWMISETLKLEMYAKDL